MKRIQWLLLLTLTTLFAEDTYFSSDEITADGNSLWLSGNVVLKHTFGTLQANYAEIHRYNNNDVPTMVSAIIKDGVTFTFKDLSKTTCESAEIDFSEKTAAFKAEKEKVFFTTKDHGLSFEGSFIKCHWNDEDNFSLDRIQAINGVKLTLKNGTVVLAESADFQSVDSPNPSTNPLNGIVQIQSSNPLHPCCIKQSDGVVYSSSGIFDTSSQTILLKKPVGTFLSNVAKPETPTRIEMTADSLKWDFANNMITIGQDAHIHEKNLGSFYATDGFSFQRQSKDGLDHFQSFGQTIFEDDSNVKIFSEGDVQFVKDARELTAINEIAPLFIERDSLLLSGKKITLKYGPTGSSQIVLENDVAIQTNGLLAKMQSILYDKNTQSFTLIAPDDHTVEITYNGQTTPVVMQSLEISHDEETQEIVAKAKGRVHFTIDDSQHQKLINKVMHCTKNLFSE